MRVGELTADEAYWLMKELLKMEQPRGREESWEFYERTRPELSAAEDTLEAIRAFNEKRKPQFTGR
jgi:enoyl-CoA hydratase/carnithine racemase